MLSAEKEEVRQFRNGAEERRYNFVVLAYTMSHRHGRRSGERSSGSRKEISRSRKLFGRTQYGIFFELK